MKKALKIFLFVILLLMVAVACVWNGELRTLASLDKVDEYLYEIDYKARYDLDEVVVSDIDANAKLLDYVIRKVAKGLPIKVKTSTNTGAFAEPASDNAEHCTSFQARNADEQGWIYGRNYDFYKNPTLVTYSHPKHGYASVAVSDMSHFGYSLHKVPTGFFSRALCLAAVYAPVDGMNEKGLCTSIMALPKQPSQQDSGKHKVGTTIIMRLFLDRCATVDEALALLSTVDVRHDVDAGSGYHYMVADAQGNCAVIEFDKNDGWKTMIVRKPADQNHMLVTNHLLSPKYYTTQPDPAVGNPHSRSWWRYETAGNYLNERNGILTPAQAAECLRLVHWKDLVWDNGMVEDTQYSAIYDQQRHTLTLHPWNKYEETYSFDL